MSDQGGMVIENKNSRIILTAAQVAALKALLIATTEQRQWTKPTS
jgi:hypothetical protein